MISLYGFKPPSRRLFAAAAKDTSTVASPSVLCSGGLLTLDAGHRASQPSPALPDFPQCHCQLMAQFAIRNHGHSTHVSPVPSAGLRRLGHMPCPLLFVRMRPCGLQPWGPRLQSTQALLCGPQAAAQQRPWPSPHRVSFPEGRARQCTRVLGLLCPQLLPLLPSPPQRNSLSCLLPSLPNPSHRPCPHLLS